MPRKKRAATASVEQRTLAAWAFAQKQRARVIAAAVTHTEWLDRWAALGSDYPQATQLAAMFRVSGDGGQCGFGPRTLR